MGIHTQTVRRAVGLLLVVAATGGAAGCARVPGVYTYVSADQAKAAAGSGGPGAPFDATAYAAGVWQSKVLPAVDKDAVEATVLLPALAADQAAASTKYGVQAGTGSPYAFLVRGRGKVVSIDPDSPSHPATIQVEGLTGKVATVKVVTGPAIAGTSLRDAVGFIRFSDFVNQLDYADVGTALNTTVKKDVLANVDLATLPGKTVTFEGAFSLLAPGSVLIVPTRLEPAA